MPKSRASIRLLSQGMINKIAAGEVIERPASVVKELLENAIDAGATRIDLAVEKGGIDLVRVVDDGSGIHRDELPLALSPHATSKITETDDLFRIRSFGFRGEALASIAEISQMTLRSRTSDATEGAEIRSDGGQRSEPVICGHPVGTTIDVRNLFFNTPVRRKYLKSVATEFGHVSEAFIRLALPHPEIHFTLRHNDRIVHDLPAMTDRIGRVARLFGDEVANALIPVGPAESEEKTTAPDEIFVRGHVGHPNYSRGNNRLQYFFLNNRYIKDRSLQHALTEAYRGLLTVGRFPIAFLEVDMSPEMFDVNVHPTKMEVRFLDSSRLYTRFLSTIRDRFLRTDLHGRPTLPTPAAEESEHSESAFDMNDPRAMVTPGTAESFRQQVLDWARRTPSLSESAEPVAEDINVQLMAASQEASSEPLRSHRLTTAFSERIKPTGIDSSPAELPQIIATEKESRESTSESGPWARQPKAIQMHDRYLVLEMSGGLAIVDQHALHERILYEKLKRQIESGRLESQGLLVPVPVDLTPTEAACALENRDFISELAVTVEPFGGNTLLITSYPAIIGRRDPKEILLAILEPLLISGKKTGRSELIDSMLHLMACKAAVKAGDHLSEASIDELIARAAEEAESHHCPHGRPSMLVFTCEELDRMFRR